MVITATLRRPKLFATVAPFRAWRGLQGIRREGAVMTKLGGERGIRTLGTPLSAHPLSRRAPSATRAPLLN